jgi:hypothetical protein
MAHDMITRCTFIDFRSGLTASLFAAGHSWLRPTCSSRVLGSMRLMCNGSSIRKQVNLSPRPPRHIQRFLSNQSSTIFSVVSSGSLTAAHLTVIIWASLVCRSRPPVIRFSVSLMEKTDAQIQFLSGGNVPEADTGGLKASDDIRQPQTLVLSKKGKIPELGL